MSESLVSEFANAWEEFKSFPVPDGVNLDYFTSTTVKLFSLMAFMDKSLPPTSKKLEQEFKMDLEVVLSAYRTHYKKKTYLEAYLEGAYLIVRGAHCLVQSKEPSSEYHNFRLSNQHIKLIEQWHEKISNHLKKMRRFQPIT